MRIFRVVLVLLFIVVVSAIILFYYIFGITEPEGLSLASWPNHFAEDFSSWMKNEDGNIRIEKIGLERLDEYGLWLQVVDETGQEVFYHNKPQNKPSSYSAAELIALQTSVNESGTSVFVKSFEDSGKTWNYLVGFPYAIGKYTLYYNGENVGRLFPVFRTGIFLLFCGVILFVVCYGFWLTRQLGKITRSIGDVSLRSYKPLPEKGIFYEIYAALNNMDQEIRHSDKLQENTERVRREWITNISHDLKTPLSPIQGYAELLVGNSGADREEIREYGEIILKNVDHMEKMMNDLKLTYQLDSGSMPYSPQAVRLVRFIKELVIDIVNDPAFHDRDIALDSKIPELEICLDPALFRRAINNLIINALTHNPPETKVTIHLETLAHKEVVICISDNGIGMSEEEQLEAFDRYYRGTSTKERPEGSGLGLAIAKQIISLHGGKIAMTSKQGKGTRFHITLPLEG